MNNPVLKAVGIEKGFHGVPVLQGVDFEVNSGEIMGLVGENGAGKSTLVKVISGLYTRDGGEITLDGRQVVFSNPKEAKGAGISIIHQELNLFSHLSIAENIFLDRKDYRSKWGKINWKKMREDARKILRDLGSDLDVTIPVQKLSVREKSLVEIAKAMSLNAKVLIMDEPTGALPESEIQNMFSLVRLLKEKGVAIVYISHRMKEIEEICDRVTVLRDGLSQGIVDMEPGKIDEVISLMIGQKMDNYYIHSRREPGGVVFEVKNLVGTHVQDISLELHNNEVLGLYGLEGAGTLELAEMVMGLMKYSGGKVTFKGKEIKPSGKDDALHQGIGYVPSDRRLQGLVTRMKISDNVIMANLPAYNKGGFLDRKMIREHVQKQIDNMRVKCTGQDQVVQNLSGGNQQKIVLGKWLDREPQMLILNEPTRGVDIGAKQEIYRLIDNLANEGLPILLVSTDLQEVIGISDRVIVMSRGRKSGEFHGAELTEQNLLKHASSFATEDES